MHGGRNGHGSKLRGVTIANCFYTFLKNDGRNVINSSLTADKHGFHRPGYTNRSGQPFGDQHKLCFSLVVYYIVIAAEGGVVLGHGNDYKIAQIAVDKCVNIQQA